MEDELFRSNGYKGGFPAELAGWGRMKVDGWIVMDRDTDV
jgi:hypothetical protein